MQRRNLLKLLQFYKFMPLSSFLLQTTLRQLLCCRTMATQPLEVMEDIQTPLICYRTLNTVLKYLCPECIRKNDISVHRRVTQDHPHLVSAGCEMCAKSWVRSQGRQVRNTFYIQREFICKLL